MDGARRALIVASEDYVDPGLKQLRAPASGMRALAAVLGDPRIGDFEVRTLLNEPTHQVNLAVEEFFADRQPGDLLLVHFSCHWVKDEDGEFYFAMANTALNRLRSTAVAAEFVNRCMSRSRSRRVVLVLDGSYAEVFDHNLTAKAGEEVGIEHQFSGRGRAVITASSAMEYAFEADELADTPERAPSVFTSALVEGLATGDADRDQDGLVGLDELYDYILDKVRAVTPHQTPGKWIFNVQGELVIARRARPADAPAPLPPQLQEAIGSPSATVRAAAARDLAGLLHGQPAGQALAAQLALKRLTEDDSRTVAAAAAAALRQQVPSPGLPPAALVLDEDVQFTVYRPARLAATRWEPMLVFAHKSGPVMDPVSGLVNPVEEVEDRAREYFGDVETHTSRVDTQSALTRGGHLSIVPELPGIRCVPPVAHVVWWKPIHEAQFQLCAGPELCGLVVRGWVRVWCGPLILAELPVALPVVAADTSLASTPARLTGQQLRRYRKIFPSYSHRDTQVVEPFAIAARVIGDQYLQDVLALDPGKRWRDQLLKLIEDADVFQLFWSSNSMLSVHCQREWEHALALGRPQFICPIYWEVPLPRAPDRGLPPKALSDLHFARIPVADPPQHVDTPHLVILAPDSDRGRRIPLDRDYMVVGREPTCDVRFDDPHVSRTHAALQRRGNRVYVQDLGSSSGTFVNGATATAACEVRAGDVLTFASVMARLESGTTVADETSAVAAWPAAAAVVHQIDEQRTGVINNVDRDQYLSHVQYVNPQRENFLREVAATKTRARRLAWSGFLTLAAGSGLVTASDLSLSGRDIGGIRLGTVGWALAAFGIILLIIGIVLRIVANSRRRRAYRDFPESSWARARDPR